jgi:hypothetical protein
MNTLTADTTVEKQTVQGTRGKQASCDHKNPHRGGCTSSPGSDFAGISSLAETRVVPGANILTPVEGTITGNLF